MKKILNVFIMIIGFVSMVTTSFAQQAQPQVNRDAAGIRAYIDLVPRNLNEIAPGLKTCFAWAEKPKSGKYVKMVSADEALFAIFDSVVGESGPDPRGDSMAIVVEGPPLDVIYTEELLNTYRNSPRLTAQIDKENDEIEKAVNKIEAAKTKVKDAKDERKDLGLFISIRAIFNKDKRKELKPINKKIRDAKAEVKEANAELALANQKAAEGQQIRDQDYARVEALLVTMQTEGFSYVKNYRIVLVSEALTEELPTRVAGTATDNQNTEQQNQRNTTRKKQTRKNKNHR